MTRQRERNACRRPPSESVPNHGTYRFALRFAYDGSTFRGFQSNIPTTPRSSSNQKDNRQGNKGSNSRRHNNNTDRDLGNTIQDQIECRLHNLLRRKARILAWGRTDAGVHARGAVGTIDLSRDEVRTLSARWWKARQRNGSAGTQENSSEKSDSFPGSSESTMETSSTTESCQNNNNHSHNHPSTTPAGDDDDDDETQPLPQHQLRAAASFLHSTLKEFTTLHGVGTIVAYRCLPVPPTFDARWSTLWKRYAYYLVLYHHGSGGSSGHHHNHRPRRPPLHKSPFLARFAWQILLDGAKHPPIREVCARMQRAVAILRGTHDFGWLSVMQPGDSRDPVRNLGLALDPLTTTNSTGSSNHNCEDNDHHRDNNDEGGDVLGIESLLGLLGGPPDGEAAVTVLRLSATTDYFLYRMVRRIVGAVVAVGLGAVEASDLEACLRAHDPAGTLPEARKGPPKTIPRGLLETAPPNGLVLDYIHYDPPI